MLRSKKELYVSKLESVYSECGAVMFVHYHGLTVAQMTNLRNQLRSVDASMLVVKNSLSTIAATRVGLNLSDDVTSGPIALVYSNDSVSLVKILVKFADDNDDLKIVAGVLEREMIDFAKIKYLTTLLSLDEYRAKILLLLQSLSTKLVRVINAPATGVVGVVDAYSKKTNK